MNYKSIIFSIEQDEYLKIKKKFLNDCIKNNNIIEESSYEDSYFDTTLQELKRNKLEYIVRKNNNSNNIIIVKNIKSYQEIQKVEKNIKFSKDMLFNNIKLKTLNHKVNIEEILTLKVEELKCIVKEDIIFFKEVFYLDEISFEIEINTKKDLEYVYSKYKDPLKIKPEKQILRVKKYFEKLKTSKKNNKEDFLNKNLYVEDFIVVVEGKNDTIALKKVFPNILTFETHGLGLTRDKIYELKNLSEYNQKKILILTDPDVPGEIIRKRISDLIPDVFHKYVYNLNVSQKSKKKIGIEALTNEEICEIFSGLKQKEKSTTKYTMATLVELGIYANKEKRKNFCISKNIAYGNNKKVLKQINDYNIKI